MINTPDAPPAIALSRVSAHAPTRQLLNDVSLTVHPGEIVALIGPNGAGKSSLLAAICGDLPLTAGTVHIDGRPLADWKVRELATRRSVLLQEHTVLFPFTAKAVVEMGRAPWRGTEAAREDERSIQRALEIADVTHLQDQAVPRLSGGERARVAFARTITGETHILLLDEPTAALDLKHQEAVLAHARQRAEQGHAVVIVVHDLSIAAACADRVVLLCEGSVVADGTPAEVLTSQRLSAAYDHPIEVFAHPRTGNLLVLPVRADAPSRRII